jgi:hypothetical protein
MTSLHLKATGIHARHGDRSKIMSVDNILSNRLAVFLFCVLESVLECKEGPAATQAIRAHV